ncbi:hypothetical protein BsWGS_10631 [Bradybaena similaris]
MDCYHASSRKSQEDIDYLSNADFLDMKNRLDDELKSLLLASTAARQDSSPEDIEELEKRVQDLQDQLLEESTTRSIQELLLKRIQTGKTLTEAMFSSDTMDNDNLFIKRSMEELDLVSQINTVHKETLELQRKLDSQKLDNLRLKKDNTELMQKLQTNKEQAQAISAEVARNRDYKRLKSELDGQCASLDIHRNLIQMLIIGIGEDWSQNPKFKQVMLDCGQPLNL